MFGRSLCLFSISILGLVLLGTALPAKEVSESYHQIPMSMVTATLTPTSTLDFPGSVQVLDRSDFHSLNAWTLDDALKYAPGVFLQPSGGTVLRPSIRGAGSRGTLLLIDGRRLAQGYRGNIDVGQIPVSMIERVEIVRGPTSSIYGPDAQAGVVNIITRKSVQGRNDGEATLGLGLGDAPWRDGDFRIGLCRGNLSSVTGLSLRNEESYADIPGVSDLTDDVDLVAFRNNLLIESENSLRSEISIGTTFHTRAGLRNGTVRDMSNRRLDLGASLSGDETEGTWWNLLTGFSRFNAEVEPPFIEEEEYHLGEAKFYAGHDFGCRWSLLAGVDTRFEERENLNIPERSSSMTTFGIFSEGTVNVSRAFRLSFGLRHDWNEGFGSRFSPRIGARLRMSPQWTLHTAWAQGYRTPTFYELDEGYYQNRRTQFFSNNPELDFESSNSIEGGIRFEGGKSGFSITSYWLRIDDAISPQFLGTRTVGKGFADIFRLENLGPVENFGVESEAWTQLFEDLRVSASLTWLDSENRSTGRPVPLEQEWKGTLRLGWQPTDFHWKIDLHGNYHGESEDEAGRPVPEYLDAGIRAEWRGIENLTLFFAIDNLFDESSTVFLARERPRTYVLGTRGSW